MFAATGFGGLFALLIALACPLMMILMMSGGMHGGRGHRRGTQRDELALEERDARASTETRDERT